MNTLRTTARLTLAAVSVSLGATLAPAADKKPLRPAAKVQGHATGKPVQPPTASTTERRQLKPVVPLTVNKPHAPAVEVKKPTRLVDDDLTQPALVKQRDAASGLPTGRTQQPGQSRPSAASAAPKVDPKNVKPVNSGGGVSVYNDAGTRSGASLALEGFIDMVKGVGQVLSPKGNTHDGFKGIGGGARKIQAGTDGDPANNGSKLKDEGKGDSGGTPDGRKDGNGGGGTSSGGTSGGGTSGGGTSGGSGSGN